MSRYQNTETKNIKTLAKQKYNTTIYKKVEENLNSLKLN